MDEKKIKASYKKGVLKIVMPKVTVAKTKKVKIKIEKE
ncbi:MAG: Hsp20 family protein [Promethearchaeota archaeon]